MPDVGESSAPIRFNKVDLPLPEGPIIAINSPESILMSTLSRAIVSKPPPEYTFLKESVFSITEDNVTIPRTVV